MNTTLEREVPPGYFKWTEDLYRETGRSVAMRSGYVWGEFPTLMKPRKQPKPKSLLSTLKHIIFNT